MKRPLKMASTIIEGIGNDVLLFVSVLVALMAILLFHLLYKLNSRQNAVNTDYSNSVRSSSSDEHTQKNLTEGQGTRLVDDGSITGGVDQGAEAAPSHNYINDVPTSETVTQESIPNMHRTSDGLRWRGSEGMPSEPDNQDGSPRDSISIRVKYMENDRTLSVNRTITVGELKRLCFENDLNRGRRVHLIYSGRLLQDNSLPICSYGIANYSVVHAQISDINRDSGHSTMPSQEADLDLSKLFLPIVAIVLALCWYGFFYYRHLFSAASVIILVIMTLAFGVLTHVMTA